MLARDRFHAKIAFLLEHKAHEAVHLQSSLLRHLLGTYEILSTWGSRDALCNAGLFHSIYGTETYPLATVPLSTRQQVRSLLGDEAESLVYSFGVLVKESLHQNWHRDAGFSIRDRFTGQEIALRREEVVDLAHLTIANWLEQHDRFPPEHRFPRRREFQAMRGFLCDRARSALDDAYGFDNEGCEGK